MFSTQLADGIMGLGQGARSYAVRLWQSGKLATNVFSLCFHMNGGAMSLGGFDPRLHGGQSADSAGLVWAHNPTTSSPFYRVVVEDIRIEGTSVGSSNRLNQGQGSIVDSGTTFTYLPSGAFNGVKTKMTQWCSGGSGRCKGRSGHVSQESLCWQLARPEDIHTFPHLQIVLKGYQGSPSVILDVSPEHWVVPMDWDEGYACIGTYSNGGDGTVVGANAMQGHDVVFDREHGRIGFAESDCVPKDSEPHTEPTATAPPAPAPSAAPGASPANGTGTVNGSMSGDKDDHATPPSATVPPTAGTDDHLPSLSPLPSNSVGGDGKGQGTGGEHGDTGVGNGTGSGGGVLGGMAIGAFATVIVLGAGMVAFVRYGGGLDVLVAGVRLRAAAAAEAVGVGVAAGGGANGRQYGRVGARAVGTLGSADEDEDEDEVSSEVEEEGGGSGSSSDGSTRGHVKSGSGSNS